MPTIIGVDLMTLRPSLSISLDKGSGLGYIDSVVASPDFASMYAVVTYNAHGNAWAPAGVDNTSICAGTSTCLSSAEQVDLVKLQLSDLSEVGRVTLISNSGNGARGRELSISADGSKGSVAVYREGKVVIVDLLTMSVLQTVDVSAEGLVPQHAAITPEGDKTYVAFKDYDFNRGSFVHDAVDDGTLWVIDHSDWSGSPLSPPTVLVGSQPGFLEFGPDARLYYGRKNMGAGERLSIYSPQTGAWSTFSPAINWPRGLAFSEDATLVYVFNGDSAVEVVDLATETIVHTIPTVRAGYGHTTVVTPF